MHTQNSYPNFNFTTHAHAHPFPNKAEDENPHPSFEGLGCGNGGGVRVRVPTYVCIASIYLFSANLRCGPLLQNPKPHTRNMSHSAALLFAELNSPPLTPQLQTHAHAHERANLTSEQRRRNPPRHSRPTAACGVGSPGRPGAHCVPTRSFPPLGGVQAGTGPCSGAGQDEKVSGRAGGAPQEPQQLLGR